jgi:hypothetical protein
VLDEQLWIIDEAHLVAVAQAREHVGDLTGANPVQHQGGDHAARNEHVIERSKILATQHHDRRIGHVACYSPSWRDTLTEITRPQTRSRSS